MKVRPHSSVHCNFTDSSVAEHVPTALFYLECAAAKGYDDAYLEMYKAHALVARELKARAKDAIEKTKKDTVENT
jgi:hypothetical protein